MDNIRDLIFNNKPNKATKYWFSFLIIWLIVITYFIFFYHYTKYLNYYGQVILDKVVTVNVYVEEENIDKINNIIKINNKYSICKPHAISKEYLISEKYKKYYEVKFKCELDQKLLINNNIVSFSIELNNQTIYKIIKNKIKKGINNANTY